MTALELPRFGMGTAGIGNLYAPVSDAEAQATIATAWEGGIRYFDTAPFYGFGLAETRLGAALAELDPGQSALISTKVGRLLDPVEAPARVRHCYVDAAPFEPRFDYGRDAVLRSHEQSLARLRRDRVNVLLVHDIGSLTHGEAGDAHLRDLLDFGYAAIAELKGAGAIDAVGLGVNEIGICEYLLPRIDLDFILLAGRLTLLDQSALDRVIPLCLERGVKLIAGGPYNSGILARATAEQTDPHYDYDIPDPAIFARAREIENLCESFGVPLPVAALHFPLRNPAVASVIPGLSNRSEAAEGLDRMARQVPPELWEALSRQGFVRGGSLS
jgi:D-threo-aldose 1-dehydrogenase